MQAIVLADGDPGTRADLDAAWPAWLEADHIVIAADGGARRAPALRLDVTAWVGDGDSLSADDLATLRAQGTPTTLVEAAKDETDTELAIAEAIRRGATSIVILGALGGPRIDHALANIALLAHPSLGDRPACLLHPNARLTLITAPTPTGEPATEPLPGPPGVTVSLLPQGDVEGVTTHGFEYPLHDEPLPFGPTRGLSNVRRDPDATVTVRAGRLLVVEAPATLST